MFISKKELARLKRRIGFLEEQLSYAPRYSSTHTAFEVIKLQGLVRMLLDYLNVEVVFADSKLVPRVEVKTKNMEA